MRKTNQKEKIKLLIGKAERLLEYRQRSIKEIRNRLFFYIRKRKIQDKDKIIDEVINRLVTRGLLDDEKFAKWWIRQRIDFKPRGKRLLRRELLDKGVDEEIINSAIAFFWEEDEKDIFGIKRERVQDYKIAYKAAKQKFTKFSNLDDRDFRKKMTNFLLSRGFEFEVIKEVIKKIKN